MQPVTPVPPNRSRATDEAELQWCRGAGLKSQSTGQTTSTSAVRFATTDTGRAPHNGAPLSNMGLAPVTRYRPGGRSRTKPLLTLARVRQRLPDAPTTVMLPDTAKSSTARPPAPTGPPTMRNVPSSSPFVSRDTCVAALGTVVVTTGTRLLAITDVGVDCFPPPLEQPATHATRVNSATGYDVVLTHSVCLCAPKSRSARSAVDHPVVDAHDTGDSAGGTPLLAKVSRQLPRHRTQARLVVLPHLTQIVELLDRMVGVRQSYRS